MTLEKQSEGIYVADNSVASTLTQVDSIIFDCDGVLIDITRSYDSTIIQTTKYILENLTKISNPIDVDFKIIDGFKSTGGFNDEVDLTYAAIISIVAADKLKRDQNQFILDVIKNSDATGIVSVEEYIEGLIDISEIKEQLSYPRGTRKRNILCQVFDQIFYGPELYKKIFKQTSPFTEPGLINQDDVILNDSLLKVLSKKFNSKIAMVTGRGKEPARYSLKSLLSKFDLKNSMFLEDESRKLAKPNPEALLYSINGLDATLPLYVGDSMEDFIMAKKATYLGNRTIFCAIIGTSKDPQEKLRLFEQNGVILALDSIHRLPKVLNLE